MDEVLESPEMQDRLRAVLASWLGTPYRHRAGVKGLGVDCIHFVARVMEELGLLTWREDIMPDYPRDWHLHHTRELLSESIEREFTVRQQPPGCFKNGDILLFHFGKAASHAGIFCDETIWQSLDRIGVIAMTAQDRMMMRRLRYVYRVMR
jgi:cell wall-associated NlpC family hydrolase